ncbi:MAG: hypothetical protein IRY89_02865 [Pseudolabrys sp.]|nr:hypothetical protein [Pseudolabrys sp.]
MMINRSFITTLLCVGLVAAVMLPLGPLLFPYVRAEVTPVEFQALEAVVSAALGFGLSGLLG